MRWASLVVSRTAVVPAPPHKVFDLLADPSAHHFIDGSGTVQHKHSGPDRLSLGAQFGMGMKLGVNYRITNTVTQFVENESVAWQHFGRHTWRYELSPLDGGKGSRVTETFDGTTSRFPFGLVVTGAARRNARAIEATLVRLQQHFAAETAL